MSETLARGDVTPKTKQVQLRFSRATLEAITKIAKQAGVSRTQAINVLLALHVFKARP